MSTFTDRDRSALLVIDVQVGVMSAAVRSDEVVSTISDLVARAREQDVPVVWVQHTSGELPEGGEAWQLVPELVPATDEPVVHKRYGDSFEDTDLEEVLAARDVSRLVVTGAQTDACVRSTLHGGFTRGYDAVLVSDAHTTEDLSDYGAPDPEAVISHTNLYWSFQSAPGRSAGVVAAAEVDLVGAPG